MNTFFKTVRIILFCSTISILMLSCKQENSELLTIFVDTDAESPLALSEITSSLDSVKLELTDQSLIKRPLRIVCTNEYILVVESKSMMLFSRNGKFIRQIGTIGQGPGEFTGIWDATINTNNNHICVIARDQKRLCYDFEGNLIKEYKSESSAPINSLHFVNNKLLLLCEKPVKQNEIRKNETYLYKLDPDLKDKDTIFIRSIDHKGIWLHPYKDFITNDGEKTYLYYSDISKNRFLIDTLLQLKNNKTVANLHLDFKNRGLNPNGEKEIYIFNIYRNSRYVFAIYNATSKNQDYCFCHDTKTRISYNMKDGYKDDLCTGENVKIRPLNSDTNHFYFLHTQMSDTDLEEPNPTLYIGRLKE